MRYLITGGCGFLGSNLASEVLRRGDTLGVLDNLYRTGAAENLAWLREQGTFTHYPVDVREAGPLAEAVRAFRPEVVFHLAGQVAMTTSISDPRLDFEVNAMGSFNLLEAVRRWASGAPVVYSSTNKVYGDLESLAYREEATRYRCPEAPEGFDEALPLDFRSPYGCSKGAADQYMLDAHRIFGLKTVVFRHSSIFGGRQFCTEDQGWVGWFVRQALEQRNRSAPPFTISGNGKQVRDILFVEDLVRCYFSVLDHLEGCAGQAFNIGGGMGNSLSLLELFAWLEQRLGVTLAYEQLPWRCSDQRVFVADLRKAQARFGWAPRVARDQGLENMLAWAEQMAAHA
jgi:CDP-paratose 2-epimerase